MVEVNRRVYLGLGSNVGDRLANLRAALCRLRALEGVNFLRASSVYETEPMGVLDQPRFLNLVAEVEVPVEMAPRALLAAVKRIEVEVGRKLRERWGPREIDIDVLLFGEETVREEGLEVPHPRMWGRAFVVVPLAELAPDLTGPGGETAAQIAQRLRREQGIRAHVRL